MALSFGTYAQLQSSIAEVMHRADDGEFVAAIPGMIDLLEAELQRRLDVAEQEASTTLAVSANANSVALPTGFIRMVRLRLYYGGVFYPVFPVALNQPETSTPSSAALIGNVSVQGSNLILTPSAPDSRTLYIDYMAKFTPLSDAEPSNWILVNHPDVYLYGALRHAGVYVGADPRFVTRVQQFNEAFETGLQSLVRLDRRKRLDDTVAPSDAFRAAGYPWGRFNVNTGTYA